LENIYHFYLWKREQFPTFSDVTLGFLQNLLANAMRLQAINNELTRLRKETEEEGVDNSAREMYYIGVIVRMLIIFDPVAADLSRMSIPEKNSRSSDSRPWLEQRPPAWLKLVEVSGGDEKHVLG